MEVHTKSDYYVVDPTKFLLLSIQRPQIARYVVAVQIVITFRSCHLTLGPLATISRSLSILPKIESIELSAEWGCSWNALGSDFRSIFQHSLRLLSIKQVAISDIEDFPLVSFDAARISEVCFSLVNLWMVKVYLHHLTTLVYPLSVSKCVPSKVGLVT